MPELRHCLRASGQRSQIEISVRRASPACSSLVTGCHRTPSLPASRLLAQRPGLDAAKTVFLPCKVLIPRCAAFDSFQATTDLYGKCTTTHSGTSAAAPEAAGVFALALEAK